MGERERETENERDRLKMREREGGGSQGERVHLFLEPVGSPKKILWLLCGLAEQGKPVSCTIEHSSSIFF